MHTPQERPPPEDIRQKSTRLREHSDQLRRSLHRYLLASEHLC